MSDIRLVTSINTIDELFRKAAQIFYKCVVNYLAELGEKCKNRIKDRPGADSWYDQSGNLRSSIGYAIYSYGRKEIESAFDTVLGGSEGSQKGREMVEELARKYSDTYALVVVAAMEYAEYVEAIESKDVLASTEIFAKSEVQKYLQKAIREAEKEIQKLEVVL